MSEKPEDEMELVSHRVQLRHPEPFKWPTGPTEKRISKTQIGGQFQDAGRHHNAFMNVFHGTEIPPDRLKIIDTLEPPRRTLEELEEEVDMFKAVVIHMVQNKKHRDGHPALLMFGSLKGTVVVVEMFRLKTTPMATLALLRRYFPSLHRMMTHSQIHRLTTSFQVLQPFLKEHVGGKQARGLIDLVIMGCLIRRRDVSDLNRTKRPTEHGALQTLVWSMLGDQRGPISTRTVWEQQHGSSNPWNEDRTRLYHFDKKVPLTASQKVWLYQIARTGAIIGVKGVHPCLETAELKDCTEGMGSAMSASLKRFRSFHRVGHHGYLAWQRDQRQAIQGRSEPKREDDETEAMDVSPFSQLRRQSPTVKSVIRRVDPPAHTRTQTEQSSPELDRGSRSARDSRSSSSVEQSSKSRRPASPEPSTSGSSRSTEQSSRSKRPASPEPSTSGQRRSEQRSSSARRGTQPSGGQASPCQGKRKAPASPSETTVPKSRKLLENLDADRRIKKGRLEYLQKNPPAPGSHPMGPQYCVDCAETPPHLTTEECIVYQYLKKLLSAPHWQYPCISCSSVSHTTSACVFLHSRCKTCGFLGHMAFECPLRTPEQWLAAYLLVAHLGRGTRANPRGPIEGKWGFGNTAKLNLTHALRRLIHAKRVGFKAIHEKGTEEINQEEELTAAWMVLIDEQQRHQREQCKEAVRYQEELAQRVADILQQRQSTQGNSPSQADQRSTSSDGSDAFQLSQVTPPDATVEQAGQDEEEELLAYFEGEPMEEDEASKDGPKNQK